MEAKRLFDDFKDIIVDQKIKMITQLSKTLGKIVMENFNCKNVAIENNRMVFTIANVSSDDTFIVFELPDLKWLRDDNLEIKINSSYGDAYADLDCRIKVIIDNNSRNFYIFKWNLAHDLLIGYSTQSLDQLYRRANDNSDSDCYYNWWDFVIDDEDHFVAYATKWFLQQ